MISACTFSHEPELLSAQDGNAMQGKTFIFVRNTRNKDYLMQYPDMPKILTFGWNVNKQKAEEVINKFNITDPSFENSLQVVKKLTEKYNMKTVKEIQKTDAQYMYNITNILDEHPGGDYVLISRNDAWQIWQLPKDFAPMPNGYMLHYSHEYFFVDRAAHRSVWRFSCYEREARSSDEALIGNNAQGLKEMLASASKNCLQKALNIL